MKKYIISFLLPVIALFASFAFTGCSDSDVGDDLEQAADETKDAAEDAADEVKEAGEDVADGIKDATN